MTKPKRKYRSEVAELKRKKKSNSRTNRYDRYIERKNAKRYQRLDRKINEDQQMSSSAIDYVKDRLGVDINESQIRTRSFERREKMNANNKKRRFNDEYRKLENENQRIYDSNHQNLETIQEYIEDEYRKAIKEGPEYICCSCSGRFFRKSIHISNKSKIVKSIGAAEGNRLFFSSKNEIMLCLTCSNQLKNKKIPKLCTRDGLELPEIPDVLGICNSVEERLFSPIIPFEQIRALGFYGKQRRIKGNVVNVPIDLPTTVEYLPRSLDDCNTIQIKFKRMLSHKTDYLFERIRPARVWNAVNFLCQQPLFKEHNIVMDVNWMKTFGKSDEIDFIVNPEDKDYFENNDNNRNEYNLPENNSENTTVTDEIESQSSDEIFTEVEETLNPGESETVIQNNGLIMAPGEGQKPISFYSKDCEYLAFPKLYCGRSFNKVNRKSLTISELAKYKLRYYDRRFAECPQILFFLLRQKQIENLRRSINIVLKKRDPTFKELKVGDLLNKQTIDKLIRSDEAYKILSQDRTSPVYWEKRMKDLMAMIRQLGIPNFFLTLSAAETQWSELITILEKISTGKVKTVEEIKNMKIEYKYHLIKDDPVTCAQYFDHKFREILKVLKHESGPFAPFKLIDYFIRVEFQHRGSPHVHCLLWLDNGPKIDNLGNFEEIEEFIDKYITCDSEVDQIKDNIKLQQHKHTKSCRKKRNKINVCRFGIPFYPMNRTRILTPFTDEENEEHSIDFDSLHNTIRDHINEIDDKIRKNDNNLKTLNFNEFFG